MQLAAVLVGGGGLAGGWHAWRMARWCLTGPEGLDDDHGPAAAGTGVGQGRRLIGFSDGIGLGLRWRLAEQVAGPGEVLGAAAVGEDPVEDSAVFR